MSYDLTATEVRMRQAELDRKIVEAGNRALQPFVAAIGRIMFSRRGQAIYFGITRPAHTDDMRQMLDDLL